MIRSAERERVAGSFRDPSGRVFLRDGRLLRRVNPSYAADYARLLTSGLYKTLVDEGLLVPHVECGDDPEIARGAHKVLEPERIPFISYPYEWSFGQLKAAAIATLRIQRRALDAGMCLKDASAFNIQFVGARPIFIDTLSFDTWEEGTPWVAYRQFCQHFLGPLALMSRTDARLGMLSRTFIDGPPLDLVAALLPFSSRLKGSLLVHLHVHARAQARHGGGSLAGARPGAFGRRAMLGLIDHLQRGVEELTCDPSSTQWADYYGATNYSADAMAAKENAIAGLIEGERPATAWDLGANTGAFSAIAATGGAYTVALDGDWGAVERHYQTCVARREERVLPLVIDLSNPSGRLGWNHDERLSLADRGPADLVLALGLIHHLSLSNQVPFDRSAEFFHGVSRTLAIEFVPRDDSQVQGMLSRMPRLDGSYTQEAFEREFDRYFAVTEVLPIAGSSRRIYVMRRRNTPR